ncbi:hypothetical protein GUJ93_ZPchr0010g9971 [Zizania palustris]|uniref:Uncharacterized protein n=1 Tax=Zizania palustris TaxID=103762 RepID=A0A8J5WAP5_ZIZPA|nr:hypothetical protein GUJ93_ZPchr0010g9971 [Zizania palustris]
MSAPPYALAALFPLSGRLAPPASVPSNPCRLAPPVSPHCLHPLAPPFLSPSCRNRLSGKPGAAPHVLEPTPPPPSAPSYCAAPAPEQDFSQLPSPRRDFALAQSLATTSALVPSRRSPPLATTSALAVDAYGFPIANPTSASPRLGFPTTGSTSPPSTHERRRPKLAASHLPPRILPPSVSSYSPPHALSIFVAIYGFRRSSSPWSARRRSAGLGEEAPLAPLVVRATSVSDVLSSVDLRSNGPAWPVHSAGSRVRHAPGPPMSITPETRTSYCRHLGGFVRMLRIVVRVLELEDEPAYEGYFPRVGGATDERCEVVVTVFGPDEVLLFHMATATATGFETASQETTLQMLAELRYIFDTRLRTSIYRYLPSRSLGTSQSFYMGPSSASDPVGGQDLFMLSAMDSLHSAALQRAEEGAVAIQSLTSENEDLCRQLLEAQARLVSPRTGPRIRRTARKATGRPPWL